MCASCRKGFFNYVPSSSFGIIIKLFKKKNRSIQLGSQYLISAQKNPVGNEKHNKAVKYRIRGLTSLEGVNICVGFIFPPRDRVDLIR
jgi:hypothetical protein